MIRYVIVDHHNSAVQAERLAFPNEFGEQGQRLRLPNELEAVNFLLRVTKQTHKVVSQRTTSMSGMTGYVEVGRSTSK